MAKIQTYTGGVFETNCYLVTSPAGTVLIDAPTGALSWLETAGQSVDLLLITHGHIDHIDDAAKIKRAFHCEVGAHRDSVPLLTDPDFFKKMGFFLEVETVKPDFLIDETPAIELAGLRMDVRFVPGHCPGSLCFYVPALQTLFGGDVLFAGSIGRTDLPGGDLRLLLRGIQTKLMNLPDETVVLAGHGPATTIGAERRTNPFVGSGGLNPVQ